MSILATSARIVKIGDGYSAGENIGINDKVISSRDWTPEITAASAKAFEEAYNASVEYTDNMIYNFSSVSSKLDSSAFSSWSANTYTPQTNYLSAGIDYISSHAITSEFDPSYISAKVDNKLDKSDSANFYPMTGNPSGFLQSGALNDYYKKTETSSKSEISAAIAAIPLGDEEVNQVVHQYSANGVWLTAHQSLSAYLTKASADTLYQPLGDYATNTDLEQVSGDIVSLIPSTAGLATEQLVQDTSATITGMIPSTAGLATETDLQIVSGGVDYISGVALTSIPTGTMNVTGFEYDGNDLITAYNGSAFAGQGGGSVDTIPFVVQEPLVTGFTGDSAYIGLDSTAINLSAYLPTSSIGTYQYGMYYYVTGINSMRLSAYTARKAATADYANTAETAYKDRSGNEITSYYQPKLTIAGSDGTITAINNSAIGGSSITGGLELSAGAGISIIDDIENSATIISVTAAGGDPEVEQVVKTYSAAGTWLTAGDIAGLATTSQVDTASSFLSGSIDYVSGALTGYQPVGNYATTGELDTASGFLSGAVDYVSGEFTGYLTTAQYETDSAVFNAKQDALTFGYDEQDRINQINSSAIAGGTDLVFTYVEV